jgi:hypothetical protein
MGPPLWSNGQSFWLQIQRSRGPFPAPSDFLRSLGCETGTAQPRVDNWGATWMKKIAVQIYKTEINGRGNSLRWPRNTLYPHMVALSSSTSGGSSVGIVRLRTKATEVSFFFRGLVWTVKASEFITPSASCQAWKLKLTPFRSNTLTFWTRKSLWPSNQNQAEGPPLSGCPLLLIQLSTSTIQMG